MFSIRSKFSTGGPKVHGTWVCTEGDNVAIYSSDGRLPEQQSSIVCDVDCNQSTGLIQSCDTQRNMQIF